MVSVAALSIAACGTAPASTGGARQAAAANPDVDPGTALGGRPAPGFTLVNQFGQAMSLRQFRGKVVLLAFIDSTCTNVCPLTTSVMTQARSLLGAAGSRVQLLGVDANPRAASVADVRAYSAAHGVLNQWDFLTGTPAQLRAVWQRYSVAVQIQQGLIDHTPALYLIGPRGREQEVYLTQLAYASIGQSAQIIAHAAARLLPGDPPLSRLGPETYIRGIPPTARTALPALTRAGGAGRIRLGPGQPHLIVFFTTWLRETSNLPRHLEALGAYARTARRLGLPQLIAVDETTTEPSPQAVRAYLLGLSPRLTYPVAADTTGRVADGYGVQDQPWLALVTASGKVAWHHDGWLTPAALAAAARHFGH